MTTVFNALPNSGDWSSKNSLAPRSVDPYESSAPNRSAQHQLPLPDDEVGQETGIAPSSGSVSLSGSTPSIVPTSEESFRIDESATGTDSSFHSPASYEPSSVVARKEALSALSDGHPSEAGSTTEVSPATTPEDIHSRIEKKRLEHERQRALQRKAFEQQMMLLEMQQQQEERTLLQQQQRRSGSTHRNPRNKLQTDQVLVNPAASAPSTPLRGSGGSRQALGRKLEARPHGPTVLGSVPANTEPEEGLNGSNVPGLAPNPSSYRSMPASRRQSQDGHVDAMTSQAPGRLAALAGQRRATQQELTAAFDKMGLGPRSSSQLRSQLQDGAESPNGPLETLNADQQSALQRALARSGSDPQALANSAIKNAAAQHLQRPRGSDGSNGSTHHVEDSAAQGSAPTQSSEGFTPVFSERFLFDDELDNEDSAFVKRYNLQEDDDKFPILVRRDSFPDVLSASSAALDLAPLSQAVKNSRGEATSPKLSEWPQFGREKARVQHNGEASNADSGKRGQSERSSPSGVHAKLGANGVRGGAYPLPTPSPRISHTGRDSSAVNVGFHASNRNAVPVSPSPTVSNSMEPATRTNGSRFANHMGHSDFELSGRNLNHAEAGGLKPHSAREATFPSFSLGAFSNATSGSESPGRFGPYSPAGFEGESGRGSRPSSGFFDAFNAATGVNSHHSVFGAASMGSDSNTKSGLGPQSLKHARKGELDAGTRLEDLQGEIFALCKDQHGCRYLQKKLEEGVPSHRDMIFAETFSHFAELMTDPFGNYLCQKMLEYCTDEQRNLIVESVAPELVTISLNMHGTRAVQKTIDFLSTSRQIHSIIVALSMNVVTLIKDLNGNHVIQKCLNRLGAEDNQFIYNAVAAHCVEVATHRHGCCVLQRCIDHASDSQRIQLVAEITYNALTLVQDPFGNYVVQYVLDLSDPRFTDAVIRQFVGNVCLLSVQKFSSNVIEKCIRVSDPSIRKQLVEELLNRAKLEKLLRDSFANYVVQTSLDYADPVQRMRLVECIRPILPVIRNTPYGKRIQSKLQRDNLDLGPPTGVPFSLLQAAHHQQLHAMAAMANRQTTPDYMAMNPFGQGRMHHPQHQHQQQQLQPLPPHHQPPQQQSGRPGRQHLPPQLQHLYGGGASGLSQHPPSHIGSAGVPPLHALAGAGSLTNVNHNMSPMSFAPPPHAYGVNNFNGPPPMGMHGGPSGYPSNSNGGFGPY